MSRAIDPDFWGTRITIELSRMKFCTIWTEIRSTAVVATHLYYMYTVILKLYAWFSTCEHEHMH